MLVRRFARLQLFVALAVSAVLLPGATHAANVLHRYTFNDGTINDSAGTSDGTLVDPAGIARFNAGRVDLTANNGAAANTNPITNGAYVDLPDGLFTSAVSAASTARLASKPGSTCSKTGRTPVSGRSATATGRWVPVLGRGDRLGGSQRAKRQRQYGADHARAGAGLQRQ